jgi:hypothetical protein
VTGRPLDPRNFEAEFFGAAEVAVDFTAILRLKMVTM